MLGERSEPIRDILYKKHSVERRGMGEPEGSLGRGSWLFDFGLTMEYFHFVTDGRALFVFILDFQFELDLREYSSMYLKSRGGEIFFQVENHFILREPKGSLILPPFHDML